MEKSYFIREVLDVVRQMWGFPKPWSYPNSWMVFVRENPMKMVVLP